MKYPNRIKKFFENAGNGAPFPGPDAPTQNPFYAPPQPGAPPPIAPPPGSPVNPPQPQKQPAPPDIPPPISGGGGGGGNWEFPAVPPFGSRDSLNPFVVRDIQTIQPASLMFVMASMPFNVDGSVPALERPGTPPPAIIAYWCFPVQYVEVQVRQYFHPKGPFVLTPDGSFQPPDHSEKAYRKMGWVAGPIRTERLPVFQVGHGGQFVPFDPSVIDTPVSDWCVISLTFGAMIFDQLKLMARKVTDAKWLNPSWLAPLRKTGGGAFANLPYLYDQAKEFIRIECASPGYDFPPMMPPQDFDDFDDDDDY